MKIVILTACFLCATAFMRIPFAFSLKLLLRNIKIIRHGKKFTGICSHYKSGGHDVQWTDGNGVNRHIYFKLPIVRLKYPFVLNVYSLSGFENIGIYTVIYDILLLIICLSAWIAGIFGTIYLIFDLL